MIPLDSATAILPRMPTGRALAAEFPLTIIKPPLLDTKCRSNSPAVSSPIYRLLQSRNRRRNSSASSVQSTLNNRIESTEFVTERVQVFELRDSSCQRSNVDSVSHQNQHQNTSTLRDNIVSYCREESPTSRRNSSMESVKERSISIKEESSELTPDLSDEDSRQQYNLTNLTPETQQADNSLVIENKPPEKSEKRNKKKSLKAKKTNKKRKNSPKKGVAVSGMFARLVGRGHTNEQDGHQVNSDQKVKNGLHLQQTRDTSPNKYLSVQKLRAAYAPKKQEIKNNKATVLLPRVSNTSLTNDNTRSCTSSPRKQEQEQESISTAPYLSSPRKLLNSHDDNRVKKVYLSETHSGMITGIPCAPPSTPTVDELKKVEYIPSLTDVKSQRAVKSRLINLGNKLRAEEQKKKEKAMKEEQRRAYGAILQLKQRQRAEIYALNKVMTELENENFRKFMEEKSAETLPV
ncbi:unnamed protein product [Porites evermanni]|uniref:Small vasohibin-binding protein n=1 Tax=Porites evermanni TaxID=104178 RepID=A0ABN8QKK0_9CNID|nr:unnamed protein product [Porites evermanni]